MKLPFWACIGLTLFILNLSWAQEDALFLQIKRAVASGDAKTLRTIFELHPHQDLTLEETRQRFYYPTASKKPIAIEAVEAGNLEVLELVLKFKANPNARSEEGLSAIELAFDRKNAAMIQLLLANGAEKIVTPLMLAAMEGDYPKAVELVSKGAIVGDQTWLGTPLGVAAEAGRTDLVKLFLEKGAMPNVRGLRQTFRMQKDYPKIQNIGHSRALEIARRTTNTEMATVLEKHGARCLDPKTGTIIPGIPEETPPKTEKVNDK
ncbi:MAG: ankyrin repeat domain-containing protein [Verrucomicrobiota bacterium]|nr:ankyrin repeat domain-containing protein [Verrucomicrobiota bacterium]